MTRKKIMAVYMSLSLCAGEALMLTGCNSDKDRPPGPPPGAVSGGAAGFKAPPDGKRPEGTPPADFKPDENWQPPDGEMPDGEPPADFNPEDFPNPPDGAPSQN